MKIFVFALVLVVFRDITDIISVNSILEAFVQIQITNGIVNSKGINYGPKNEKFIESPLAMGHSVQSGQVETSTAHLMTSQYAITNSQLFLSRHFRLDNKSFGFFIRRYLVSKPVHFRILELMKGHME